MSVGDIYKLTAIGIWEGQGDLEFNLHYQQVSEATDYTNQGKALAELFRDGPYDVLKPALDNDYQLTMVRVRNVNEPTDGYDLLCDLNGSHSGETLPLFNAAVISIRSDKIGKSYINRCYIPAVPKDAVSNNSVGGAYAAILDGFMVDAKDLGSGVGEGAFTMVVYSKKLGEANPVEGWIVRNAIGHQDRRKVGIGS